jgi:hypothetical protein
MIQQDKVLPSSAYKPPGKLLPFCASCFGSFKNEEKEKKNSFYLSSGCHLEHYVLVNLKMRKKRKIIHFTKHWLSFTEEHCVFVDLKMRKSVSKNIVC